MKCSTLEVAIAGAGIGGLALSILLAKENAKVVVYDQMTAPKPVGSGFVLQPTGLAVLAAMGLKKHIQERGARITNMYGRLSKSKRTVLSISYDKGRHGLAVQRAALFNLLFSEAVRCGVQFETSSRITAIEPQTKPRLLSAAGVALPPADLVIDAMGASSTVGASGRTELNYGALWATVAWPEGGPFHPEHLEQRYQRASRMAGVLPVGTVADGAPPKATFFWSLRNRDFQRWCADGRTRWIEEVSEIWPEAAQFAESAEPVHAHYRHHTRSATLGQHAIKIGDAWHATSPQLGQGANMALLDAMSLILALKREASIADALAAHLAQRRPHITLYQMLSLLLTPFYQSDSRLLPFMRDIAIGPVTALPGVRQLVSHLVTGELLDPLRRIGLTDTHQN
ncbi:FAD-dependent oxidoreductase [Oryzifoliimicrobium ureilyticus]|uniref:FAD-dependent oxidoreductase n=1 Tax=Oryzifoliimicrobium ureilyticus TaxID=3113724 RepID=UPI0030764BD8